MTRPLPIRQIIDTLKRAAPPEPFNTHHGFPMPRVEGGALVLAVISCPAGTQARGLALSAPRYLAIFDPATGKRLELRDATAAELGGPVGSNKEIGVDKLAPGQTADAFLRDQEALCTALDLLLPLFAEGRTDVTAEQKKAASTFLDAFPRVAEVVLAPYYQHVGRAWLDWLHRVSR